MDPRAVTRFSSSRLRSRFQKEYRFALLGAVKGKRILDVGCGDGVNAVLLAMLGAHVTGVDVSERAVEVARKRAWVSGVGARTRFTCSPIETFEGGDAHYDIIWCDSILHHLIPSLDGVLGRLTRVAAPGARFVAYEPVNFSPRLRRFRRRLPIPSDATPDERPLESTELQLIQRYIMDLCVRHYALFARLNRFVLAGKILERASVPRRAAVHALVALDAAVLRFSSARRFAGQAVLSGWMKPPDESDSLDGIGDAQEARVDVG
jgi:ubiquinone/menaquinone biosynthesis C-methylase UbiE